MRTAFIRALLQTSLFITIILAGSAIKATAQGCEAGEILVAEDAKNWYCLEAKSYENSQGQKLATQYCSTKKIVAADQNAIRNLGFAVDAERYEAFGKVAEEQQRDLKRKAFEALFDQGLDATGKLMDSAKSLNPWNVNKAVKLLEDKGLGNPELISALREISRVKGKPAMAEAYHHFEQLAKAAVKGYNTGQRMADDPNSAQLQLLVGALKTMQGNYELGLIVTGAEFGESMAYLSYISGQVDDLSQQTDDKLARLGPLGTRLKDHVNDLAHARKAWQDETDIPIPPRCER
jgi:hypothetical protein